MFVVRPGRMKFYGRFALAPGERTAGEGAAAGRQPWSFSETVLMGFFAELDGEDTITLDTDELATAGWFTREEAPAQPLNISLTSEMIWKFKNGEV